MAEKSDYRSIEKLNDTNWKDWHFQVWSILDDAEAWGIIDGSLVQPQAVPDTADLAVKRKYSDDLKQWQRANKFATRVLATTVGQKALTAVHSLLGKDAKTIYDRLKSDFEKRTEYSKDKLWSDFFQLKHVSSEPVATFRARVDDLIQDLKECGEEITESAVVARVISALPEGPDIKAFRMAWDSTTRDRKTLNDLFDRLHLEEERAQRVETNGGASAERSEALMVHRGKINQHKKKQPQQNGGKPKRQFDGRCYRCGGVGHVSAMCTKPVKCFNCGANGHLSKQCRKGNTVLNAKKECVLPDEEIYMMCSSFTATDLANGDEWISDSGSTDHMTPNHDDFVSYKELSPGTQIRVGNGEFTPAAGIGDVQLEVLINGQWKRKTLSNVLHVPALPKRLFSHSAFLSKGKRTMEADAKQQRFFDGKEYFCAVNTGKLYILQMRTVRSASVALAAHSVLQDWHEKFVHQDKNYVKRFLHTRGINVEDNDQGSLCDGCAKGKAHRLPFNRSENRSPEIGDLIHADVNGPLEVLSLGHARFFLQLRDDSSNYRVVFFLQHKSDVANKIKEYVNMLETQTGNRVKKIRSDNGGEFVNTNLTNYFKEKGIVHQVTIPYTPQQNGRAERDNRTVMDLARSVLQTEGLPKCLWAEAVATCIFILNHTGKSPKEGKVPVECWGETALDVDKLHIFGTNVYVHIPDEKRKKLDAKGEQGRFVGYGLNKKGYRIWFGGSRIETHRNVIFEKSHVREKVHIQLPDKEEGNVNQSPEVPTVLEHDRYSLRDRSTLRKPARYTQIAVNDNPVSSCFHMEKIEPTTYEEALADDDCEKWVNAMDEEMHALWKNKTWELVDLPEDHNAIDSKWIYKIKERVDGTIERYKARLVIRGFTQKPGIDFDETFSPVIRQSTVRSILCIAAMKNLSLFQFDIKSAFLNGVLQEEIYMVQPKGYEDGTHRVCLLKRSLYGLKQASRCWNEHFEAFLLSFGVQQSREDPCLFLRRKNESYFILGVHVDDGIIATNNDSEIDNFLQELEQEFEFTFHEMEQFLGCEVEICEKGISLRQTKYTHRILVRFGMCEARPVDTPMDSSVKLETNQGDPIQVPYREAVGSLLYLATGTRPDIVYAVNKVSQFMENPGEEHWTSVKRIFRYLRGTSNHHLFFASDGRFELIGWSDSDFAGCNVTARSTSGHVITFGGNAITWGSKRQSSVAMSTAEAETVSATRCVRDMMWLHRLLEELLGVQIDVPLLYIDCQGAIKLIENPVQHDRTRHMKRHRLFVREVVQNKTVRICYCPSQEQIADIFTKPLAGKSFSKFRTMLQVID